MKFFRFLTLFVSFAFPCVLFGQSTSASLTGVVDDPSKAVIPKVSVTAINTQTGVKTEAVTNSDGVYVLTGLIPGSYRIEVDKQGFKGIIEAGLTLHTQDIVQINFHMAVGSMSETVTVNANGMNINTTDASVSTVIDRQFVANMPLNGRSLQDLETLAPGVLYVGSSGVGQSGEITVNGQRTEANSFSVDGVSATVGTGPGNIGAGFAGVTPAATALGTTQSMVSVDALQEFRATTSTYSAEYGRTPGGQFSFTTRSGTNDWHGSAFDYFRNEALDANNWFNNAATPQVPREKERQNDFGGTLGGPVWIPHVYNGKDKTFFFFSYEGLRLWTPQGLETLAVPDQDLRQQAPTPLQSVLRAFPLPNKGEDGLSDGLGIYQAGQSFPSSIDSVSIRIDHNFSDKFKIFGRFANTPTVSSSYFGATETNNIFNSRLVTVGADNIISSTQTNELKFNITRVNAIQNIIPTTFGGATPFDVTTLPGPANSAFSVAGSQFSVCLCFGGYTDLTLFQIANSQTQYNATDSYKWTLGRHNLIFGGDWRRLATYSTPTFVSEYVDFASEAEVLANNPGPGGGFISASASPAHVEPLYVNLSAFAQDEWKASPRLSLSLGLRWDVNPAPTNLTGPPPYTLNQITDLNTAQLAPEGTTLWKTDWHALAPRIGGAYQIRQTPGHETVFRAGFGMFYDLGNTTGSTGYGGVGYQSSATLTNVNFPLTSAQITLPPPSIAPPYNSYVSAFDPNLELPYTLQWNVAVQQSLGSRQALTVSYVGSASRRLLETYDVQPLSNPNFGPGGGDGVNITKNGPTSDYSALQGQFQRTLSHGLQALASYTYSHSIDDASSNFDLRSLLERASSDFDIRHNVQAALTYDVPGKYLNPVMSELLERWSLDIRVSARSALPVNIIGRRYVDPTTATSIYLHPNVLPGEPLYLYGSQYPGGKIINYSAFTIPTSGPGFDSEGNTSRNYARGFGAWQTNLAVRREFPIRERLHVQFRAEAFNAFNHTAFSSINSQLSYGPFIPGCVGCSFGEASSTLNNSSGSLNPLYGIGGPRSLQLALKLLF
ncbi:MAG TPA: carboxypeptidase regulatory-like domain-containing protein [Terracidiphilus sp.]